MDGDPEHGHTTPEDWRTARRLPLAVVLRRGWWRRCPRCGQGALFSGYLTVAERCSVCGLDYAAVDSGDGPAVFVIFVVGFIVTFLALGTEVLFRPPYWVHAVLWGPMIMGLSLWLLPPFKAVLVGLQYRHGAREAAVGGDEQE